MTQAADERGSELSGAYESAPRAREDAFVAKVRAMRAVGEGRAGMRGVGRGPSPAALMTERAYGRAIGSHRPATGIGRQVRPSGDYSVETSFLAEASASARSSGVDLIA